jgi:predicted dehydrogenase
MHVMSETTACKTLGEAVELVRTVEKTGKIYMLAENYCYFAYNQEMRRLYKAGEVGEVQFAECEYNHPADAWTLNALAPGLNHWRNWIPSTYYCTHALGPIMFITDTRPVAVNALAVARSPKDRVRDHVRRNDPGSMILCRMDNGAVVHIFGLMLRGHSVWYRIHGTRGLMENLRHGNQGMLRIVHEAWDMKPGDVREKIYTPEFPVHQELARMAGHGGGDFFTTYYFAEAIRSGRQPWLDVYRGLDMSIVGIQAWKSALKGGAPVELPDMRKESVRRRYAGENWSPFAEDAGKGQPPPSITGMNPPSARQIAAARRVWRQLGYTNL